MPILPLSEITPAPVEWLWPRRLALGHLHVFDGDPGNGKSMLLGDLAARISTGRPWPDAAPSDGLSADTPDPASPPVPASVMILNAEDDAAGTTYTRLAAAGADLSRIHVWSPGAGEPLPLLPGRLAPLRDAIARVGPRLVVLDPIPAFLDRSVAFNSDPDIRRALRPLAELAAEHRCAIVLVRHLTKRTGGRSLYRGLGSVALIASCRIAWLAAADPKNPTQYVLAINKNNFSSTAESLAYSIPDRYAAIAWLGPSPAVAVDLVAAPPSPSLPRFRARALIAQMLRHGPRTSIELRDAARAQNISPRTLRRAAKELNLTYKDLGNAVIGKTTYCLLPGQRIPREALNPNSLDIWLERLDEAS